jgi:PadR family transcriptional regulator, regulatory protein PadR
MGIEPQTALLQALISGPGYGLELIERVKNRTEGKVLLGNGKVYPALRDLERAGFVESYKVEENLPQRDGRPRIYYRLTGAGFRAAQEERQSGSLFGADLAWGVSR